jgi:hypothetical protein
LASPKAPAMIGNKASWELSARINVELASLHRAELTGF